MSYNAMRENKILAKIYESTVCVALSVYVLVFLCGAHCYVLLGVFMVWFIFKTVLI